MKTDQTASQNNGNNPQPIVNGNGAALLLVSASLRSIVSNIRLLKLDWALLFTTGAVVAFFGLMPFDSYAKPWVNWNPATSQTDFGDYGLASGPLTNDFQLWSSIKLTLAMTPASLDSSSFQVILQIDTKGSPDPLIVGQWRNSFILMRGRDYANKTRSPRLQTKLDNTTNSPVILEFLVSSLRNRVSINDTSRHSDTPMSLDFILPPDRITVGNSPDGTHGWAGSLSILSIEGLDESQPRPQLLASYRFDRQTLGAIDNDAMDGAPLTIPRPGNFPDRKAVGTVPVESLVTNYKKDVILNVIGLFPLGFAFAAVCLRSRKFRSPISLILTTLVFGAAVGILIESTQTLIPGRSPHLHDMLLNCMGAGCGAAAVAILRLLVVSPRHHTGESDSTVA